MSTDVQAVLPIVIVVAVALITMVVDWFTPDDDARIPGGIALTGLVLAAAAAWRGWSGLDVAVGESRFAFVRQVRLPAIGDATVGLLRVDAMGIFTGMVLLTIAIIAVLMAIEYLGRHAMRPAEFIVILLSTTASMMLLAMADDLVMVFLGIETFSIGLYVLCGFRRDVRLSLESAFKYFVLGAFSAGFLLYGIALIYVVVGTTSLTAIGAALSAATPTPLLWMGVALLLVGLGFKVAIVPFHQWTPDVYEGAPMVVTAFMSAGTKLVAFVALIRILYTGLAPLSDGWMAPLVALSVATMFVGNLAALVQSDLKRMLGYSAVAHAGYILVAVLAGPGPGASAALFYLLIYALMNLGAFTVLIAMGDADGSGRDVTALQDLAGLAGRHPWLAGLLSLFLISLTGLPPTAGFLAKWYVFSAALGAGLEWSAVAIVAASVLSAFYYLRPIAVMYMTEPEAKRPEIVVGLPSTVALTVTATVVAFGIVLAAPLIDGARAAAPQPAAEPADSAAGSMTSPSLFLTAPELERERPADATPAERDTP